MQFVTHIACNRQSKRIRYRKVWRPRLPEDLPPLLRSPEIGRNRHLSHRPLTRTDQKQSLMKRKEQRCRVDEKYCSKKAHTFFIIEGADGKVGEVSNQKILLI